MSEIKSLSEQVYEYILWEIREGKIRGGDKLSEAGLAETLDISRTPVREALFMLCDDGLLISEKNKGFFVRQLSMEERYKKAVLIAELDAFCAEAALPYITEDHLLEMEDFIKRSDLAIQQQDVKFYTLSQMAFHRVYYKLADNEYILNVIDETERSLGRNIPISDDKEVLKARLLAYNDEHRAIVEAFREKDLAKLRNLCRTHWYDEEYIESEVLL